MDAGQTIRIADLNHKELGRLGEDAAARYVEGFLGLTVVRRNWSCAFGEADIVAQDVDVDPHGAVLVEVKTRLRRSPLHEPEPEVSVTEEKRRRYARIALKLLSENPSLVWVRFDVAAVVFDLDGTSEVRYFPCAFTTDGE